MDMYNVIKTEPDTRGEIVLESESRLKVGLMFDKKYLRDRDKKRKQDRDRDTF